MVDFHAVPGAMRENVNKLYGVADSWIAAREKLVNQQLGREDLGTLGDVVNVSESYNQALETVLDRMARGFDALENAARTLKSVADEYECRDLEYYREFGYVRDETGFGFPWSGGHG